MTVNRTTLLDLPLPVTGTESGTWGDTTNNGLTQYMDIAIAGMSNLTSANFTAGALTIETTEGDSSATNISATSAQYAGFRVSSLAVNSTITVGNTGTSPARSYRLINADATYSLTFKATGQTGVTLLPGQSAVVAFNGTDYVIIGVVGAGSTTDNTVPRFDGTTGEILQSSGVTIDDSNNVSGVAQLNITTLDATNIEVTNIKAKDGTAAASIADSTGVISVTANPVLSGGTANGVLYLNGSKVATSGSALVFNGTRLDVNTGTTGPSISVQGGAGAGNEFSMGADSSGGFWQQLGGLPVRWFVNGSEQMRLTSTGLGIGTSSPAYKLDVQGGNIRNLREGSQGGLQLFTYSSNQTYNAPRIETWRARGTAASPSVVASGDELFSLQSSGYNASAGWTYAGGIFMYATGTVSGGNVPSYLSFDTSSGSSGVERMRLDSSGNLGIGTSSPSAKLHVVGSGLFSSNLFTGGNNTGIFFTGSTSDYTYGIGRETAGLMLYSGSATARATLDASGNLGLGVTPSAWASKALQVGSYAALTQNDTLGSAELTYNCYRSSGSTWNYINSDTATRYRQWNSAHTWFTAASGTAGNAITFTQSMTLDASGNLGIGTSSPNSKLEVQASAGEISRFSTAAGYRLHIYANASGSAGSGIQSQNSDLRLSAFDSATNIRFFTGNGSTETERARITSGGDLLVGTTTTRTSNGQATQRLQIQGSGSTDGGAAVNSFGNDAFASNLDFFKSRGTGSTNTIVQSGDTLGKIWWSGADGTAYIQAAGITAEVDGTPGTNDMPGRLVFFTTADGAALVTERMRITSGGEVYIAGTTDQGAYNLQCNGTGVWGAGAYVNGSDERLKDDIQSLDSCLNVVNALRPVTFKYKPEHSKDQSVQTGFIAQELQQVLAGKPYLEGLVQEGPQHLNVAYQNIIPLLVKAIQEQQALITALTARVALLEGN